MKPALQQSLYAQFPSLHRHLTESTYDLAIGDGWYSLYYDLCTEIELVIEARTLNPMDFYFTTVKEKFGLLRVYMSDSSRTDEIAEVLEKTAKKSERTCERCGGEGKMNEQGWLSIKCEECRRTEAAEREARQGKRTAG